MKSILDEINGCLEHGFYFAGLSLALILPDVCASFEKGSKSIGDEYADWCNRYVKNELEIDGAVVYSLRCSFLHALSGDLSGVPAYKKHLEKQEKLGETRNQPFRFFFPHSDASEQVICYEETDGEIKRMPCISHMICALMRGFEQFKQDNPDFSHEYTNLYFEG